MGRPTRILLTGIAALAVLAIAVVYLVPRVPEGALRRWDERWSRRVAHGERLVENGEWEQARVYLEALDDDFPARTYRHRRDTERERILAALSRALTELGREKRTVEVCRRAVEFAPRNYMNHFRLAEAHRIDGNTTEAMSSYLEVIRMHPSHLPSVRAAMAIRFGEGRFAEVARLFDDYLDSLLLVDVRLAYADDVLTRAISADGRVHTLRFLLPKGRDPGAAEVELGLSNASRIEDEPAHTMEIAEVRLGSPLRVGTPAPSKPYAILDSAAWGPTVRTLEGRSVWLQGTQDGVSPRALVSSEAPVSWIEVDLRLIKRIDDETREMALTSYRNLLQGDGLGALRDRLFPATEAGR